MTHNPSTETRKQHSDKGEPSTKPSTLQKYDIDTLHQVIITLKIKVSRLSKEMDEISSHMTKFLDEHHSLRDQQNFYLDLIRSISSALEDKQSCQKSENSIQPANG